MRDRILHLADLHLGASLPEALQQLDPAAHTAFKQSRDTVLERLADWISCPESRVGLVLIAGDLFDTHHPNEHSTQLVTRALARIGQHAPVVTVPGNHDEYSYPDCVYRQTHWPGVLATDPEPSLVCRSDLEDGTSVAVYAVTYEAGKVQPGRLVHFPSVHSTEVGIAVVHGTENDYFSGPVLEGERCFRIRHAQVAEAGYRYLAMGHIHRAQSWALGQCAAAYPGPPVGPSPADPGSGNLLLMGIEGERTTIETVDDAELLGWRWVIHEIDVEPGETPVKTAERLAESLPVGEQQVCVARLRGHVEDEDFARELETRLLEAGRSVVVQDRDIRVLPPRNLELLLKEESLAGEFARCWDSWRQAEVPDECHAAQVLREGWIALERR